MESLRFSAVPIATNVIQQKPKTIRFTALALSLTTGALIVTATAAQDAPKPAHSSYQILVENHCFDCHDNDAQKGDLNLQAVISEPVSVHPEIWEKVVRRLRARQMPPTGKKRLPEPTYEAILLDLETSLSSLAEQHPRPGRTDTLRRLTRTEYQNAIRDLLALDIAAAALLPADESSHGFDNITVGELSPTLLSRYVTAAQKISRLAIGSRLRSPGGDTIRIPPDATQEKHVPGLPIGTRGGTLIPYNFPQSGEYEIQVHLTRDRNEKIEGLNGAHEMEILLDRKRVKVFTIKPPKNRNDHTKVDANLKTRILVDAGPRKLGVTFVQKPFSLIETKRQPYESRFNHHRHPRQSPAIFQVSITGPFNATEPSLTPSRNRIFGGFPPGEALSGEDNAQRILSRIARRAYRRPVIDADLERPMQFFREAYGEDGFDAGIEMALSSILVSPQFLFRIEKEPANAKPNSAYSLSDIELASRLSFFLWSSIPDDELLEAAARGDLSKPAILEKQTRRMIADPRSRSLVDNFANQWLYLRNLDSITPNARLFPDFDDNLRQAMKQETELLFESVLRDDKSVVDLLQSDTTFLNERLAKHYQIPHVYGSRFRRVALDKDSHRGGLLRHGSILTVTSYATRTSPVIRGNWILENIIGTPPPPPPADVSSLEDNSVDASLPMRAKLAKHRANKACAACHNLMDPVGFSLENFDAIGRWRTHEEGLPVDVSGGLPDGSKFAGAAGLENGLLKRPELFAGTFTEKLMTFALGRGVEHHDGPAVRKIVTNAARADYRMSSIILGIVNSVPFKMRQTL